MKVKALVTAMMISFLGSLSSYAALVEIATTDGTDGVSGHVQYSTGGSFGIAAFHVKNSGATGTTTRKGYMRFDASTIAGEVTDARIDLVVSLIDTTIAGDDQRIRVYGITDETLDAWSTTGVTWANAPANDTSSAYAADLTEAVELGSFYLDYNGDKAAPVGTVVQFTSAALIDFLNTDSNGQVTFILGRTGTGAGKNLLFAGDTHVTYDPPTLVAEFPVTGAVSLHNLSAYDITSESASVSATLSDTNADVTVYWDAGTVADLAGFTGWDGTNGPIAEVIGPVVRSIFNLTADTLYTYAFYATNQPSGSTAWASDTFATSLTDASKPVFTDAKALSPLGIRLKWADNANTETGYVLQRSVSEGSGYDTIATLGANATSYEDTDSGLDTETTYYYQLAATNTVNESGTDPSLCRTNFTIHAYQSDVSAGADFEVDAGQEADGDQYWEDLVVGNPSGLGLLLDNSPAVIRVPAVSRTRLTHAFEFPGGSTGNEAGALLVATGTTTAQSFEHAPGDWSLNSVSLEIWFKPDNLTPSTPNGQILFESGGGTGLGLFITNNLLLCSQDGGAPSISYNLSTDPSALLLDAATEEFIQVLVTRSMPGGTGDTKLYINGALVGTASDNDNDWTGSDGAAFGTLGAANTGGYGNGQMDTESFDGQIALIRLYSDQILTTAEVAENFRATAPSSIQFTNLAASGITADSANLQTVVNTDLAITTVFWDTEDKGLDVDAWSGSDDLGAQSAGALNGSATGLSGGSQYYFRFYGELGSTNGWSGGGAFITPLSSAQKPVFTNSAALSSFSILLEWEDNAAIETGYVLQRSIAEDSGYVNIATLGADTTSYNDRGLSMSTTYYYQLAATNTVDNSSTDPTLCRTFVTTPQFPGADETMFYDDFDRLGTGDLNGTTPSITTGDTKWVAMKSATNGRILDDGRIDVSDGTSANRGGSATLAFTPQKHYVYTLDLSAINLNSTASHTTANRLYFGFARGQSSGNGSGTRLQPGDSTVQGQLIQGFMTKVGYTGTNTGLGDPDISANDTSVSEWLSLNTAFGGNIDLRVVLDTRIAGAWTATWYARRSASDEYSLTHATEAVIDTNITSVGFGLNTFTSGYVTSFKLTGEYKPSGSLILLR